MKRRWSSKHSIEDEVKLAIEWETMRKEIPAVTNRLWFQHEG
jgi:hypothetical protein